jgi:hypothetical protein
MSQTLSRFAAPLLTAAAISAPLAAGAADTVVRPNGVLPAVMHFKVDYTESSDAPVAVQDFVLQALAQLDFGPQPAKPGCATVSGSGRGWDDSDYWGNGC